MQKQVNAVSLIASVRSTSTQPAERLPAEMMTSWQHMRKEARSARRTDGDGRTTTSQKSQQGTKCSEPPKGASAPDRPKKRAGGRLVGEHHIYLGGLRTRVTIRIYKLPNRNLFFFTQSHFLHTPKQMDPYMTNAGYGDSYKRALLAAWGTFFDLLPAVRAGHKPQESWLVTNPDF